MNNKTKGEFSEARALYEFQKYNIPVAIPWGDNQRYDMIAEFNGKLNKIQVKTSNEEENGSIKCYCRSSKNHTTNKKCDTYQGEIDYFVFYNQTYDKIAIVPMEEIGDKKVISLRIMETKMDKEKELDSLMIILLINFLISKARIRDPPGAPQLKILTFL